MANNNPAIVEMFEQQIIGALNSSARKISCTSSLAVLFPRFTLQLADQL
jgi:hypothetical protein